MRGGKAEGRTAEPLFPRLHVNDTEKGGPRAPPRNKMALYEQLSIPAPRVTDGPPSMLPLPPIYGGNKSNVESSSQGLGVERATFSPFQTSAASDHSKARQGSCSADGLFNKTSGSSVKRLTMTAHTGNLSVPESVFPTKRFTSYQTCNVSQFRWSSLEKDEIEFNARGLVHPGNCLDSSNRQSSLNNERFLVGSSCSLQLQTAVVERLKTSTSAELGSEGHLNILNEEGMKTQETDLRYEKKLFSLHQASQESNENPTLVLPAKDNISPTVTLKPLNGKEHSELSNQVPTSSNFHHKISELDETSIGKSWGHVDITMRLNEVPRDVAEHPKVSATKKASVLISESCHDSPVAYSHTRTLNAVGGIYQNDEKIGCHPPPANFIYKNEDLSNTSVFDSVSHAFLSPDDIVEILGHKHFWKARRTIINQQNVFSMQVFELHRIIKVQKIIYGSRNSLKEESLFLGKTFSKPSSVKGLSPKSVTQIPSSHDKTSHDVPKIKVTADNPTENQPCSPLKHDLTTVAATTGWTFGHNVGPPLAPVSPSLDNKLPMWCLPLGGNQWLVPMFSMTEGWIYKPCEILPGAPVPTMSPAYFAPYGMPIMNPSASASNIEHISSAVVDTSDFYALNQSSCIVASERNDAEKLESRASIPKKRSSNDALPLFPTAPTDGVSGQPVQSCSNEQKTRVIRVIPRNPRLASESAARIIELIQEERKQMCK